MQPSSGQPGSLCLLWNEEEKQRNAALLQRFCPSHQVQGLTPAETQASIAYMLGMVGSGGSGDAAPAAAAAAAAPGGAPGTPSLSSLPGLLPSTAEESHAITEQILALKHQLQQQQQQQQAQQQPMHREQSADEESSAPEEQQQQQPQQRRRPRQQQKQARPKPPPRRKKPPESDEDWGSDGPARQPKPRGRPPKLAGRYSKGYQSIKRWREKKRDMVGSMEATASCMAQQLATLQEQRAALQKRHELLEAAVAAQDEMLSQFADLKLSVTAGSTATDSDPQRSTVAAPAGAESDSATGPLRAAAPAAHKQAAGCTAVAAGALAGATARKQQQGKQRQGLPQPRRQQQMQPGGGWVPGGGQGAASSDGSRNSSPAASGSGAAPTAAPTAAMAAAAVAAASEPAAQQAGSGWCVDADTASSSGDWAGLTSSGGSGQRLRLRHQRWGKKAHEHQRNLMALLASYKQYISECAAIMCVMHIDQQQQQQQQPVAQPADAAMQDVLPAQQQPAAVPGQAEDAALQAALNAPGLLPVKQEAAEEQSGAAQAIPLLLPKFQSQAEQQQQQQQQQLGSGRATLPSCLEAPHHPSPASCRSDSVTGAASQAQHNLAFPPMPFSLTEVLSCWRLAREGVVDPPAAAARAGAAQSGPLADLLINLETGQHDYVPPQHWLNATKEVCVRAEQRQRLEAGWELFTAGLEKLNREREALQLQLAAAAMDAGGGSTRALQHQQSGGSCCGSSGGGSSFTAGQQQASGLQAAGATAVAAAPPAAAGQQLQPQPFVSCVGARLAELDCYQRLADAVERHLLHSRAVVTMFGWALWQVFDDEQIARMSVRCFPYWPLPRALVACLLGREQLLFG